MHAYVLMGNHYHLLLETPEPNLVVGMKWLQGTYTMRFNRRHRGGGHLFQGRYKAIVVDPEEPTYLLTLSDYIHLNPIRAGLVQRGQKLFSYPWSSYPSYLLGPGSGRPGWLKTETVLGELDWRDNAADRRRYAERMKRRAEEGNEEEVTERGWYLGGEVFRKRMLALLDGVSDKLRARKEVDGDLRQSHDKDRAEEIFQRGLQRLGLKEEELSELKKSDARKIAIGRLIRQETAVDNRWIAGRVGLGHVSRVSRYCSGEVSSPETRALLTRILSD